MAPDPRRILERLSSQGIRLGLERPRRLAAALGDPHDRFPAILVAGTNGKGSTAAMLAAMARAAGYRTGLYTSPYLEQPEEEIRLDGQSIDRRRLGALLERVVAAGRTALGGDPTPFEAMTAAAWLHFAEKAADLAVLEAGMGGARDATNLCSPILSLITSVSLEHRRFLGDTLARIAREKAGIFRAGRPALARAGSPRVGPGRREDEEGAGIRAVLVEEAATRGAAFYWIPDEVALACEAAPDPMAGGQTVHLTTPCRRYRLDLAMDGEHQAWNLALAVRAAEILAQGSWPRLDPQAIAAGAAERWPGRLEPFQIGARRLLLDGAHDPEGAAALAVFLEARDEPYDLLFGVFEDKDAAPMLASLTRRARRVVLTRPPGPRGRDPEELRRWVPARCAPAVEAQPIQALDQALATPGPTLVVCGSIALVGVVRGRVARASSA